MKHFKVSDVKIKNPNGTYFVEGSILPLFYDPENQRFYIVEEYEAGNPCEHDFDDLISDGVEIQQGINK